MRGKKKKKKTFTHQKLRDSYEKNWPWRAFITRLENFMRHLIIIIKKVKVKKEQKIRKKSTSRIEPSQKPGKVCCDRKSNPTSYNN